MPELLAPKKVTCTTGEGRFLTSGESLPRLSSQILRVSWYCQLPEVVCQSYWLPVHRYARTTSSLWWYARALAPREVTSVHSKGRFITTSEPPPSVVFSASLGWMILSAPQGGMPELLAPCWEESTSKWRLCIRELLYMACAISNLFSCSVFVPREPGNNSHHPQSSICVKGIDMTGSYLVPWRDH
jgi:hypothetical protein